MISLKSMDVQWRRTTAEFLAKGSARTVRIRDSMSGPLRLGTAAVRSPGIEEEEGEEQEEEKLVRTVC